MEMESKDKMTLDKEQLWKALKTPTEKSCLNCKHRYESHLGPACARVKHSDGSICNFGKWQYWKWDGKTK